MTDETEIAIPIQDSAPLPDTCDIHKLLRNGLAILGKIEHFTEEELHKFTHWVAGRL